MKRIVGLMAVLALGALGGCTVTSEAPLFGPKDASAHPLAEGLWALTSPGCEIMVGQPLPECALGLVVGGGKITGQDNGALTRAFGGQAPTDQVPTSSEMLLVEGKPQILQLLSEQRGAPAGTPLKPAYMGLNPLHLNTAGQVDRAVMWMIVCPPKGEDASSFKTGAGDCVAETPEAVRRRAAHIPPFLSFFMTWVNAQKPR